MAAQLRRWAWSAALALWACTARAQGTAPEDSSLAIVSGLVRAVEFAWQRTGPTGVVAEDRAAFLQQLPKLDRELARSRAFVKALESSVEGRPDLLAVARARGRASDVFGADLTEQGSIQQSLRYLLSAYGTFFRPALDTILSPDSARLVEKPVDGFRSADLVAARDRNLERIRHYEIKYGPGSAKLNAVETLLNFGTQRLWPFKPGADGVSRFEMVAGYSTSYATVVEGEATAISAAEFGLRIYNWGYRDEPSTLAQASSPRYWTLAVAVGARDDGALEWPWERKPRIGPAIGWGEFKLAYLHAKANDWRVIVSRQMQLLPHLF